MATLLEAANVEYLTRASAPSLNAAYSVHLRTRFVSVGSRQTLFYADAGVQGQNADWCYLESDGTFRVRRLNATSGNELLEAGASVIAAGADLDLFLIRSGTIYTLYLNGAAEVSGDAGAVNLAAATRLFFGNAGDPPNMSVSDLAIWTEALSAPNRALVIAGSASAYTTNQWGRWKADVHTAINDLSGNARNLTAVGTLSTVTNPVVPSAATGGASVLATRRRRGWRF